MFNNVYTGNYNVDPIPVMEIDMSFKCTECSWIGPESQLVANRGLGGEMLCPSCSTVLWKRNYHA